MKRRLFVYLVITLFTGLFTFFGLRIFGGFTPETPSYICVLTYILVGISGISFLGSLSASIIYAYNTRNVRKSTPKIEKVPFEHMSATVKIINNCKHYIESMIGPDWIIDYSDLTQEGDTFIITFSCMCGASECKSVSVTYSNNTGQILGYSPFIIH